ncbi:hypothetical protein B0H17DRAFT_919441 [Mycena rosella]|uniref:LYR motif-containing protein Cup1-like N-terminal domain-containing protein n=1 Tax=Mycena rosella TaxID=1033263 RepID=A0AAD7M934_MYCRO|nr:hypothetical protein B0H17DRAFT_919441 [Mycena rosella]
MTPSPDHLVFGLYRAFLRQTRKLPHLYLQQFWRIKAFDDVRAILKTDNGVRDTKFKRMAKDLRKLEAANNRDAKAFNHILAVAYGRKGKLKRELMEPILTDPTAPIPPRIIPAVESSRPPVYSKELKALLISGLSRTTKPLVAAQLEFPPTLPPRADPASEEARLLGSFSKRRETNARWRYFVAEWQKVRPPLQVVVRSGPTDSPGVKLDDVRREGIRSLPMQGLHVFEDVEKLASPPLPLAKRRTRNPRVKAPDPDTVPSRWLRRRYQELLSRIPVLTYTAPPAKTPSYYSVSLSPSTQLNIPHADTADLEWMDENTTVVAKPKRAPNV